MSLDLTAARDEVVQILAGLDLGEAYGYLPARTSLPAFLVLPADPYITGGQTFGRLTLHFRVAYISALKANQDETADVDIAISAAVNAFLAENIAIDGASSPYAITVNGNTNLAADLTISFPVSIN
jgi:hypothetical protein